MPSDTHFGKMARRYVERQFVLHKSEWTLPIGRRSLILSSHWIQLLHLKIPCFLA